MKPPTDEALAGAATPLRQVQMFTEWVGAGRKLTQTGRITLADARELVGLLGTADEIDPKIGDRVFRTRSGEELPGFTTIAEWAKASGLERVTGGLVSASGWSRRSATSPLPCHSPPPIVLSSSPRHGSPWCGGFQAPAAGMAARLSVSRGGPKYTHAS
jgi:hypothetical protein